MYQRKSLMQACLCAILLILGGMAIAGETVYDKVVNRDKEPVYVISNLPQEQVMRPICGEALSRNNHCRYVSLGQVGMFGKRKSDLTNYDWRKGNETIVVVDRSKLDVGQKVSLQRIMNEMFPVVEESKKAQVFLRAQNVGDRAWQAIIDVPDASWLDKAAPDLMSSVGECQMTRDIQSVALLSNESDISSYLFSWFRYGTKQEMGLDKWQEFRDASGLTHRILALNWNGSDECTAEMANEILPAELRCECDTSDIDPIGLNRWQRFCRQAVAQSYKVGDTDCWIVRAPTAKYLRVLSDQVVKAGFQGGPYTIPICDLTHVKSLAIGTYVASPDPDRGRLVLQQELESAARQDLQGKIESVYTTDDLNRIIEQVLGPDTGNPFVDPAGADKVVQASNADALLVLWVRDLRPITEYSYERRRLTQSIEHMKVEDAPKKPDPEDRDWNGSHLYPGENRTARENSHEYREAVDRWQGKYSDWRRKYNEWENQHDNLTVNWEFEIKSTAKAPMLGYLKVIDLKTKNQLWSCPVEVSAAGGSESVKVIPVQTRGDDNQPEPPGIPQNEYVWNDATYVVGQEALMSGLKQGLSRLLNSSLWPSELTAANRPAATDDSWKVKIAVPKPDPVKVSIEKIGSMPCTANPTGAAKTKLSKAAQDDAVTQILEDTKTNYPSAGITRELIAEKLVVVSEGWNPKDKEYRVRVKFDTETTGN